MKTDFSRILYDKYFKLSNRNIEVLLRNGKTIKGVIIGFFKGDDRNNEPYIIQWHIVDEKDKMSVGVDVFGFMKGEIIKQKEIVAVKFCFDNSVLRF